MVHVLYVSESLKRFAYHRRSADCASFFIFCANRSVILPHSTAASLSHACQKLQSPPLCLPTFPFPPPPYYSLTDPRNPSLPKLFPLYSFHNHLKVSQHLFFQDNSYSTLKKVGSCTPPTFPGKARRREKAATSLKRTLLFSAAFRETD